MYQYPLHQKINALLPQNLDLRNHDNGFYARLLANADTIQTLYQAIYKDHPAGDAGFDTLLQCVVDAYTNRPPEWKRKDAAKAPDWFLSNRLNGMSLYVDRFAGNLAGMKERLTYFQKLGINLLHLMPIFESPPEASDGGYAVSNFRKVDARFGDIEDLRALIREMNDRDLFIMQDIVLNHTSDQHDWALRAKQGDAACKDFYYFFPDRRLPDWYDQTMPEIFPESAPGNFSFNTELNEWVMTVFHRYQWDLNYTNPLVLTSMLDNIFFYANLGVDILRIDAPAFIWKSLGTTSQNLPEAHTLLRLIKCCVEIVAPGMAILGEAIVAPQEIMKYFGTGAFAARECDFAYNATQMALQWDALATGKTMLMRSAQHELQQKPIGSSWISYTRSHDDIGFGFGDEAIRNAGYEPYHHRNFLKEFYSGTYPGSFASGALFSNNPRTGDARISGSLASLCGLEKALSGGNQKDIRLAAARILLMQAMSFYIGGLPMMFYGDEFGSLNQYDYLLDASKSYDNRWMHRPVIAWEEMDHGDKNDSIRAFLFRGTQKLLRMRKALDLLTDLNNISWLSPSNEHIAAFVRTDRNASLYCLFNFSPEETSMDWTFMPKAARPETIVTDYAEQVKISQAQREKPLFFKPYGFYLLLR